MNAQAAEIDWPLTLQVLAVVLAGVGLIAAVFAAVYSKRSLDLFGRSVRFQEAEHRASIAGIEVSQEELWALRRIERNGPFRWATQTPTPTPQKIGCWVLEKGERGSQYLLPEGDSADNKRFVGIVRSLTEREILTAAGTRHNLNETSRAILRKEEAREVPAALLRLDFFTSEGVR